MASSKVIIVFILPVLFSIIFGSAVMADTLQKSDRELNMWPMTFSGNSSHDSDIKIIGLAKFKTLHLAVVICTLQFTLLQVVR